MSGGFNFGFSGDDFDEDHTNDSHEAQSTPMETADAEPTVKPMAHKLQNLMAKLPPKISWNTIKIESPKGSILYLPRRELFDVRVQIMAQDEDVAGEVKVPGLDNADIRTNVYEGGFKSWECSFDLARLLLDRGPRKDIDDLCRVDHVIEMGCGTAIPVSVLFHYAITQALPLYFTFTDYNLEVLELVTLPNLLLTFASTLPANSEAFLDSQNPLANLGSNSGGDLEITAALKDCFVQTLSTMPLTLTFISGSWSPATPFLDLIPTSSQMNTLVLASETIYSPSALKSFTTALVGMLRRVRIGKAMIAAKRFYFGVGGSIDAFKIECSEQGAVGYEIENHNVDLGEGEGVRRCLLEVQML
ncbi:hypothetical protein BT63DRAFT_83729 [Microthyrium microscopicum]|uniref:protein-histidine N-methyltransferase n=1 Tax=Microthyrium microscopicum TaxID=703497 RepID=A0A6A6U1P0_9PEZI|nr:hypothetical protein BT63DRAFT_83729 [Microthyrium microscopicum]